MRNIDADALCAQMFARAVFQGSSSGIDARGIAFLKNHSHSEDLKS